MTDPNPMPAPLNQLYPVFLKADQLHTLVVGGGNVAEEKLHSLLGNSPAARITVVASRLKATLPETFAAYPHCRFIERSFEPSDLDGKQLAILATDDPALHQAIKELATRKGVLVNVADTPALCDFYLGSIVQKGHVKIAISTNGQSPTLARRLKDWLNAVIPISVSELSENLNRYRQTLRVEFAEKVRRLNVLTRELAERQEP